MNNEKGNEVSCVRPTLKGSIDLLRMRIDQAKELKAKSNRLATLVNFNLSEAPKQETKCSEPTTMVNIFDDLSNELGDLLLGIENNIEIVMNVIE